MTKPNPPKPNTAIVGTRGPAPQSFERWVNSASKRGAKRFRVHLADGTDKLLAHKTAADSARRMRKLSPLRVEALDEQDAELAEWHFVEAEEAAAQALADGETPGYLKEDDDSGDERLLKTFAHLLSDAYKHSSRQLVEVVSIQSRTFNEERKNLLSLQLTSERLLTKRLRGLPMRVRVSEGEEGEEGEGEASVAGGDDSFLQDLLTPILQRMATKAAGHMAEGVAGDANGAAIKEEKTT